MFTLRLGLRDDFVSTRTSPGFPSPRAAGAMSAHDQMSCEVLNRHLAALKDYMAKEKAQFTGWGCGANRGLRDALLVAIAGYKQAIKRRDFSASNVEPGEIIAPKTYRLTEDVIRRGIEAYDPSADSEYAEGAKQESLSEMRKRPWRCPKCDALNSGGSGRCCRKNEKGEFMCPQAKPLDPKLKEQKPWVCAVCGGLNHGRQKVCFFRKTAACDIELKKALKWNGE